MSVYNQILTWSESRPMYLRDALRRIITSTITNKDIEELSLLIKKEFGDATVTNHPIPFDQSHIPSNIQSDENYPKLLSIKNPENICALHEVECLEFLEDGLTIIYGSNGSGKSSYSRILKKLCWSRASNIELKTNVFSSNQNQQQIEIKLSLDNDEIDWTWVQGSESHSLLSSIYVFDAECSDVYINKENPADYKPAGIDLLEKLIVVINKMQVRFESELLQYNTVKPPLPNSFTGTPIASWYSGIEGITKEDIEDKIQFTIEDSNRKRFLESLINSPNLNYDINTLKALRNRIQNYFQNIFEIQGYFSYEKKDEIQALKLKYDTIKKAYELASNELTNLNTLNGFGSNPWRVLWNSARDYAHSQNMTDKDTFPSNESLERCVLCQQELDEVAKQRMLQFSDFVLNDISKQYESIVREYLYKKELYSNIGIPSYENIDEIKAYIDNFDDIKKSFDRDVGIATQCILVYLNEGGELTFNIPIFQADITPILENIDNRIKDLHKSQEDRTNFINEYRNIEAKEFLLNHKADILKYIEDYNHRKWIKEITRQLNTSIISRKIGEIMTDGAINIQHNEFITHLKQFDTDLADRIKISKSRTTQGQAFMKCGFNEVSEDMSSVLSEGEQRIVAFSNFLAECTLDNKLNTLVFDDPVTSLDIDYRELIAKKLVELAQVRQVIILTHDLAFTRMLMDSNQKSREFKLIGIDKYDGKTGIITDEIPYLAKNIQERINSIRKILAEHDSLPLSNGHEREVKLDSARKRFRMLLEKSVEDILSNKTYTRFSKNINLKRRNLSSYVITEESDINFILNLFGKYSITEHDGGISTIHQLPTKDDIVNDIREFSNWKDNFGERVKKYNKIAEQS